ncbi:MAG: hypothetical protein PHW17_08350 [Desulfobacterales bacterium]|nr:hypothetical protein [Desulfobacterales bacterium]MDD3951440.1 hypothetical protein [Desulfobacterales bacterium]
MLIRVCRRSGQKKAASMRMLAQLKPSSTGCSKIVYLPEQAARGVSKGVNDHFKLSDQLLVVLDKFNAEAGGGDAGNSAGDFDGNRIIGNHEGKRYGFSDRKKMMGFDKHASGADVLDKIAETAILDGIIHAHEIGFSRMLTLTFLRIGRRNFFFRRDKRSVIDHFQQALLLLGAHHFDLIYQLLDNRDCGIHFLVSPEGNKK